MRRRWWGDLLIVLALTGLAFAVRVYRLPDIPVGLYVDEAANGLDVLAILNGHHSIFFERNSGREPLFIYLQAISVALLGATPFALRLTAAVLGALTVPAIYWMVREAFADTCTCTKPQVQCRCAETDARWLGGWTALFVAFSYWHITFSRLGFRVIMLPLLAAVAFAWFWRAWRHIERGARFPWLDATSCGVCVGLSLYTYLSARFLPLLLFGVGAIGIARCRQKPLRHAMGKVLVVMALAALVVFAPLGLYFLQNPQAFLGHASAMSVLNPYYNQGNTLRTLAESIIKTAGMFVINGDPNLRHNPAQRPLLDPALAVWLLLGLILSVRRWRSLPRLWGVLWIGVFAAPVILGVQGMPHSLRGLGMLPAVFMLPVLAMDDVRAWLADRCRIPSRAGRYVLALLPLPFLLLSATTSLHDYFTVWQRDKGLATAFEVESIRVAQTLSQRGDSDRVWLLPLSPLYDGTTYNYTLDFTYRGPVRMGFVRADPASAPERLNALTAGLRYGQLVHWLDASPPLSAGWLTYADPKRLLDFLLAKYGRAVETRQDTMLPFDFLLAKHGRAAETRQDTALPYTVYELPAAADYRVATAFEPLDVSFGDKVRLTAAAYGRTALTRTEPADALDQRSLPAGHTAWAALRWQAQQPIDRDLKASLRLLDADGHLAGQVDDLLVGDTYPFTRTWPLGEAAGSYHILPTLPAIAPGAYQLHLVVYDAQTGATYPARAADGTYPAASFPIGALEITRPLTSPDVTPAHAAPARTCPWAKLCLLGFDLPTGPLSPGDILPLTLYWRAERQPAANLQIGLHLRDEAGKTLLSRRSAPNNGRNPTAQWAQGDVLRDWHDLSLPPTLLGGAYILTLSLYAGDQSLGEVNLGRVEVSGRPRTYTAPVVAQSMTTRFGDAIAFLGYDIEGGPPRAGEPLALTLHWHAQAPIRSSYTVFVHVLDAGGRIVAQQDSLPGQGALPTSSWVTGEYIADTRRIPLPAELPAGAYQIRIGLYDATTSVRLPVADAAGRPAGDSVTPLTPVTIAAR